MKGWHPNLPYFKPPTMQSYLTLNCNLIASVPHNHTKIIKMEMIPNVKQIRPFTASVCFSRGCILLCWIRPPEGHTTKVSFFFTKLAFLIEMCPFSCWPLLVEFLSSTSGRSYVLLCRRWPDTQRKRPFKQKHLNRNVPFLLLAPSSCNSLVRPLFTLSNLSWVM